MVVRQDIGEEWPGRGEHEGHTITAQGFAKQPDAEGWLHSVVLCQCSCDAVWWADNEPVGYWPADNRPTLDQEIAMELLGFLAVRADSYDEPEQGQRRYEGPIATLLHVANGSEDAPW